MKKNINFFEVLTKKSPKKIDFAHRSGALARPGSQELRAVKIPASYVSKIRNLFFVIVPGFWRDWTIFEVSKKLSHFPNGFFDVLKIAKRRGRLEFDSA